MSEGWISDDDKKEVEVKEEVGKSEGKEEKVE